MPYPLRICKAEGYLVLLQTVRANVAIFMLTKENRKVCNKTKTPPTSLLGHRGLSWLLPFLSILVSKVSIDFSIFLRVRGNDLQRGESNSQSSEEEKKVFDTSRLVPSHTEKNHEKTLGPRQIKGLQALQGCALVVPLAPGPLLLLLDNNHHQIVLGTLFNKGPGR